MRRLLLIKHTLLFLLATLYQITERSVYRDALRATAQLIANDFTSPEGGFVSRIGLEDHDATLLNRGSFHQASWSYKEVRTALEPQDAEWFIKSFYRQNLSLSEKRVIRVNVTYPVFHIL